VDVQLVVEDLPSSGAVIIPNLAAMPASSPLDSVCQFLRGVKLAKLFSERNVVVLHDLMTLSSALKVCFKPGATARSPIHKHLSLRTISRASSALHAATLNCKTL
jgi:hypothetical protein